MPASIEEHARRPDCRQDLCYTRGVRTMGGTRVLRDFVPDEDATVV